MVAFINAHNSSRGYSLATILSLDVGTSSLKAALIDEHGTQRWWHREEFRQTGSDRALAPALQWMDALSRSVRRCDQLSAVDAVAVSGHGPSLVPVDRSGGVLEPVLMWHDGRRIELDGIASFYLPKVKWLAEHEPSVFAQTSLLLSCPEYVTFALTGAAATFTPSAEFSEFIWSAEQIEQSGFSGERFPDFVGTGERVGSVSSVGSELSGIPQGVPVFAGGSDFIMSLYGTATVFAGRTCDRAGTSEGINYCSADAVDDARLRMLPHPEQGLYNIAGILSSTGTIFEWYRSLSGQKSVSYGEMLSQLRDLPMDRHVPWFFPSIHQGAAWEFSRGMFIELGAEHGPLEMGRAVVESIGYAVREAIEILAQNGCSIQDLRACGGQARNETWNQMKADMTGIPVAVGEVVDAELLGNACAALHGLGYFASLREAAESLYTFSKRYEPRPRHHAAFTERFERYVDAYQRFRIALAECDLL